MLTKLNRVKKENEHLKEKCKKLTQQNEEFLCSLAEANLKLEEYKQKEQSWLGKLLKRKS